MKNKILFMINSWVIHDNSCYKKNIDDNSC